LEKLHFYQEKAKGKTNFIFSFYCYYNIFLQIRTATVVFRESSWVLSLDKTQFDHIMGNYRRYALDENVIFLKTF